MPTYSHHAASIPYGASFALVGGMRLDSRKVLLYNPGNDSWTKGPYGYIPVATNSKVIAMPVRPDMFPKCVPPRRIKAWQPPPTTPTPIPPPSPKPSVSAGRLATLVRTCTYTESFVFVAIIGTKVKIVPTQRRKHSK